MTMGPDGDARLPIDARASLIVLAAQVQAPQTMIGSIERRLIVQHRANEASKRLESVPGIGLIGASAIAATITDPNAEGAGLDGAWAVHTAPRTHLALGATSASTSCGQTLA
jgi:transposase